MNPSIKNCSAEACRYANRRCHRHDSDIDFAATDAALGAGAACRSSTVDLFLLFFYDLEAQAAGEAAGAVACVAVGMVAGAVGSAVAGAVGGAVAGVVGYVVADAIGGAVAGVVADAVFSDVYAVAAAVVFTTYRPLILVPEIYIPPGDDIMNAPRPNVEREPARSSWLMERRETRNFGMYVASSFEPGTLTGPWWDATTVDSSPSFMSMLSHSWWAQPLLPLRRLSPCWWFRCRCARLVDGVRSL